MAKYILKRLLLMIPVILGVTILVCTIMYFTPGDAASQIAGEGATEAEIQAVRDNLGLEKEYLPRLLKYLERVFLHFDLGKSFTTGTDITQELMTRFPNTLILACSSIIISLLVGIPLGIMAAVNHNSIGDYLSMFIALFGVSAPGFWVALILVEIFARQLGWLPPFGVGGIEYWVLPIFSSCLNGVATMARQSRSSMLDVMRSDYVVMARSKGVSEAKVIFQHALPNALIPIITIAGSNFGAQLAGGLVIETIFSIPGVGYYLVKSVGNRDYNAIQGGVLLLAITFSVIMLLTDLIMALVDPRIRAQFSSGGRKRAPKTAKKEVQAA